MFKTFYLAKIEWVSYLIGSFRCLMISGRSCQKGLPLASLEHQPGFLVLELDCIVRCVVVYQSFLLIQPYILTGRGIRIVYTHEDRDIEMCQSMRQGRNSVLGTT
ncbi:hypothetical protein KCU61_g146, partial [Aureobasidium melanogenum]